MTVARQLFASATCLVEVPDGRGKRSSPDGEGRRVLAYASSTEEAQAFIAGLTVARYHRARHATVRPIRKVSVSPRSSSAAQDPRPPLLPPAAGPGAAPRDPSSPTVPAWLPRSTCAWLGER